MQKFEIEYRLHKDKSWIGQEFDTQAAMMDEIKRLKEYGYKPRRVLK